MIGSDSYNVVFPEATLSRYRWLEIRHASVIMSVLAPDELADLVHVLDGFRVIESDIRQAGGNQSAAAKRLNDAFGDRGWREGNVDLQLLSRTRYKTKVKRGAQPPDVPYDEALAPSYAIDNLKGSVAVDVEWNAKDGNLDRDIAAYRAVYEAGLIVAAVMITTQRMEMRQWALELLGPVLPNGKENTKFDTSTVTSMEKAEPKLRRGDGGGCPILVVGICRDTA